MDISKNPQKQLKTPKIKALIQQIESGQLSTDKARILNYVKSNPGITIRVIEKHLNMKHETASARVSGLMDIGLIAAKEEGRYSQLYFVEDQDLRQDLSDLRKRAKFHRWLNKAEEFEDLMQPAQRNLLRYLGAKV